MGGWFSLSISFLFLVWVPVEERGGGKMGWSERVSERGADILSLKHVSRIIGHCNNPALPFCPVCGCGISSCSVLKYWLRNEKQELLGCCNVWESSSRALEQGYLARRGTAVGGDETGNELFPFAVFFESPPLPLSTFCVLILALHSHSSRERFHRIFETSATDLSVIPRALLHAVFPLLRFYADIWTFSG